MIKGVEAVMIGSENAKALAEFYASKVGIEIAHEYEMGEDGSAFEMKVEGSTAFYINSHSEVKGKAAQPQRIIINFEVDDIDKEVEKLDKAGVKKIQDKYHIEGYGYVATFEDLDGNYFQVVQVRAN